LEGAQVLLDVIFFWWSKVWGLGDKVPHKLIPHICSILRPAKHYFVRNLQLYKLIAEMYATHFFCRSWCTGRPTDCRVMAVEFNYCKAFCLSLGSKSSNFWDLMT